MNDDQDARHARISLCPALCGAIFSLFVEKEENALPFYICLNFWSIKSNHHERNRYSNDELRYCCSIKKFLLPSVKKKGE